MRNFKLEVVIPAFLATVIIILLTIALNIKSRQIKELRYKLTDCHDEYSNLEHSSSGETFMYTEILEDICLNEQYTYTVEAISIEGQMTKFITIYGDAKY